MEPENEPLKKNVKIPVLRFCVKSRTSTLVFTIIVIYCHPCYNFILTSYDYIATVSVVLIHFDDSLLLHIL